MATRDRYASRGSSATSRAYTRAMTYSTDDDVRNVLGPLRDRLPAWLVIEDYRDLANADLVDRLARVYTRGVPAFAGQGLAACRFAEAKLAAAEILDSLRVSLGDELTQVPDQLRAAAYATIEDGVVGYPPGAVLVDVDGTGPGTALEAVAPGPRASSYTPASAFPDPYEELRDSGIWNL